jgi:hypothetical protein
VPSTMLSSNTCTSELYSTFKQNYKISEDIAFSFGHGPTKSLHSPRLTIFTLKLHSSWLHCAGACLMLHLYKIFWTGTG